MGELQYHSEGRHRPSFRFRHVECGNDMGRVSLENGRHLYVCERCDVRTTLALASAGEVQRYAVEVANNG